MSEFVKKTIMGYREVQGGRSDPECTHVILTEEEYSDLLQEVFDIKQEIRTVKENSGREIRRVRSDAQSRIEEAKDMAEKRVVEIERELELEKKESAYQRSLNATLLRISKERANAERKLTPKKKHTGYVVTYSMEKEYRYKIGQRGLGRVMLWETILQSPYSADFEERQARIQIWEDLFRVREDDTWEIARIGINAYVQGKYETLVDKLDWKENYSHRNVLLFSEIKLRLNFNQLYWEIILLHTKPLGVVPPDMRAR